MGKTWIILGSAVSVLLLGTVQPATAQPAFSMPGVAVRQAEMLLPLTMQVPPQRPLPTLTRSGILSGSSAPAMRGPSVVSSAPAMPAVTTGPAGRSTAETLSMSSSASFSTPSAEQQPDTAAWPHGTLVGSSPAILPTSEQHWITSSHTGRRYRIQTTITGPATEGGYPVFYTLDGDTLFSIAAMAAHALTTRTGENGVEPMLVVGVGYSDEAWLNTDARVSDYTPHVADGSAAYDPRGRSQGGANRFLAFLKEELEPALAQRFPIDPKAQTLFGHSFGGLFTLHTLFTQPDAFQCYIASSPSLWWHHEYILQERDVFVTRMQERLAGQAHAPEESLTQALPDEGSGLQLPRLRLSIGEYEQKHAPRIAPDSQRAQMLKNRGQVDRVHRFVHHMRQVLPQLQVSMTEYPQATHGSAQVYAMMDALRHACGQE